MDIENPTVDQIRIGYAIVRAGYISLDDVIFPMEDKLKRLRALEREKAKLITMVARSDILK